MNNKGPLHNMKVWAGLLANSTEELERAPRRAIVLRVLGDWENLSKAVDRVYWMERLPIGGRIPDEAQKMMDKLWPQGKKERRRIMESEDKTMKHPIGRRRLVTPLERLLRTVSLEHLLSFLQTLGIRHSVTGGTKGFRDGKENSYRFVGRVFVQSGRSGETETIRCYEQKAESAGDALRRALCEFLATEDFDFHDYRRGEVVNKEVEEGGQK